MISEPKKADNIFCSTCGAQCLVLEEKVFCQMCQNPEGSYKQIKPKEV